ncbi:CBO0543 family protein [Paenibacillus chartarius]|uniref:CBO0543 family protein n=1 Tax=Paenibacillus chartarius TaxID=747481 RepID=A0ABV6DFE9_9BACL
MIDYLILGLIWILTFVMVVTTTPRDMLREALAIFMFKHSLTWLFGLLVVEYKLIEYPVREFPYASKSSFSFEYFIYPAICIMFNLRFPRKKSMLHQIGWFVWFPSWMTILEVLVEKYTNLIHYVNWSWYWTWLSLLLTFGLSRMYFIWFMKKRTGAR